MVKIPDIERLPNLHLIYKGEEEAAAAVLQKLRSYLDSAEPELVYFLVNTWRHQGKAITYKELREAILNGDINAELLDEWRQDYSRFVVKHLQSRWEEAILEANREREAKYPDWYFNPASDGVQQWTATHSAEFVTSVTDSQIQGLRAVIRRAAVMQDLNVDQLARAIRPLVGLYDRQAVANLNYYNKLIESGMKESKALDLSIRYAARQHRYRGYLIARQELAMAYNTGSYEGIKQAQAKGYMGQVVKIWCTADDERKCKVCGAMEGAIVGMEEDFDIPDRPVGYRFTKKYPPAHYMCRCTVLYKEIKPHKSY